MSQTIESVVKRVFSLWKRGHVIAQDTHPDEQVFASFFERKLAGIELEEFQRHILACRDCSQLLAAALSAREAEDIPVPAQLLEKAGALIAEKLVCPPFEVVIALKEKAIELLSTAGDVLIGQEFIPAMVLRSRKRTDFEGSVTIFKDCDEIRVQIKIERRAPGSCDINVTAVNKASQKVARGLRVSLLKADVELESYLQELTGVVFENVVPGSYSVTISGLAERLVSISLQLKGPA